MLWGIEESRGIKDASVDAKVDDLVAGQKGDVAGRVVPVRVSVIRTSGTIGTRSNASRMRWNALGNRDG